MAADVKTIHETSEYVVSAGKAKIEKNTLTLILQGILAGIFIGIGAIGYYKLASMTSDPGLGTFLGSAIFPVGIVLILMLGAELFTSDTMMIMGVYNKEYKLRSVLRVLGLVLVANFIGMIFISLLSSESGIFTEAMTHKIIHTAQVKTSMPISQLMFSSILCNIIVCTGVWSAYAMKNAGVKILVLWFVITVFALSGTEHIVANMYYLLTALFLGADISVLDIGYNLLFVTIGNFIGGAIIVTGINKIILSRKSVKVSTISAKERSRVYAKASSKDRVIVYKEKE